MKSRTFVYAKTIDLGKIGWSETQIVTYIKGFVFDNYNKRIDKETALIICNIIDDLLSDIQRKTIQL